ncbi:MAG: phosphatase PAP2 family protein [Caulobacteraceae bacterium]
MDTERPSDDPAPRPSVSNSPPGARLARSLIRRGRREVIPILVLAVVALGALFFIGLIDPVVDGHTVHFDEGLLLLFREPGRPDSPIGPWWVQRAAIDFTALGSTTILTAVVIAAAGLFVLVREWRAAIFLIAASVTGTVLVEGFKVAVGRTRPPTAMHLVPVSNASFPSGHAAMSALIYLTLAALVARFSTRRRVETYALVLGVVVTFLIGLTRIYVGVHWPTDVIAGWALGACWASLWWLIAWASAPGRFRETLDSDTARCSLEAQTHPGEPDERDTR